MVFKNRQEAGKQLAVELINLRKENPFVLAMPRGGVPIGYEIAEILQAPLEVIVVRKIGLSGNSEFGIGAIAEGGVEILDEVTINALGINREEINNTIRLETFELNRRVKTYRGERQLPDLAGRTAILVDDGMATGLTAEAGIEAVKKLNPKKIIIACPVCPRGTYETSLKEVDGVICLAIPSEFMAVGAWYDDFRVVSDEEVGALLKKANETKRTSG